MPQLSRVEELVTKEPTALDINDILTAIDKIPSGTTKEVVLLHLSSLTDQEIAQKMGMSAWSVRRKIDLVRKLLEG
jgi:DNA-directed RNA polymerase specialized sigma24 family protein